MCDGVRLDEAIEIYKSAVRASPKILTIRKNLADAYMELGKYEEALLISQPFLNRKESQGYAHRLVGDGLRSVKVLDVYLRLTIAVLREIYRTVAPSTQRHPAFRAKHLKSVLALIAF